MRCRIYHEEAERVEIALMMTVRVSRRHVHGAGQSMGRLRVRLFLSTATTNLPSSVSPKHLLSHGCCSSISYATRNSGPCHHLGLPRGGGRPYHDQAPHRRIIHQIHELIYRLLQLLHIIKNAQRDLIRAVCGRAMSLFLHLLGCIILIYPPPSWCQSDGFRFVQ